MPTRTSLWDIVWTLVGIVGAVLLAGLSLGWHWLEGWLNLPGVTGATVVGIVCGVGGLVLAPIRLLVKLNRAHGEVVAALKTTLAPTASRLIAAAKEPSGSAMADVHYSVMKDLRAFIASDGTNADANLYALIGSGGLGTRLVRTHPTDTGARRTFALTKAKSAKAHEESAVVKRVVNGKQAHCHNVKKLPQQEKWNLDGDRERTYVAFMSVPVLHEGEAIGMLSVNCSKARVIRRHHVTYLDIVAKFISELHQIHPLRAD